MKLISVLILIILAFSSVSKIQSHLSVDFVEKSCDSPESLEELEIEDDKNLYHPSLISLNLYSEEVMQLFHNTEQKVLEIYRRLFRPPQLV